MKRLSEKQAWIVIRDALKQRLKEGWNAKWPHDRLTLWGLCFAILVLGNHRKITSKTQRAMNRRISLAKPKYGPGLWWSANEAGAKERVKWINRLLRKL